MKALFTIHAGEFLVASYIERKFKEFEIWFPSKDTGVDLLIINSKKIKKIQVKYALDFGQTVLKPQFRLNVRSVGWYQIDGDSLKNSKADLWIFVIYIPTKKEYDFIIIPPKVLLRKLNKYKTSGKSQIDNIYFLITDISSCFNTRNLSSKDKMSISNKSYSSVDRDFTTYLNNWKLITK